MVLSRYSYFFTSSAGINLGYCSKSNSLIELPSHIYKHLKNVSDNKEVLNTTNIDEDTLEILTSQGFVGDSSADDDYIYQRQFFTQAIQHGNTNLNLVIVPTLNCNFSCPYCFEKNKQTKYMTSSVEDELIKFIKETKVGIK